MDRQTFSRRKPGMVEEEKYRKYAVLIPVLTIDGAKYLLFEKRSSNLKHQPGEICFPGGKLEPGETLKQCAVRETMEELNVTSRQIKVLGPGDIYISPFRLIIHSFIGELKDYNDTFSTDEVEEIIKVPLDYLKNMTPETYESMLITEPPEDFPYEWIPGGNQYSWTKGTRDILFYRYENWVIWGMTAQILQSCLELMKQYHLFDSLKEER
ncbi:MAG: CoA pyrophosphatase [Paenibacillaceae bacterium]|nr:CoA pyrophosphatase [Paenibacillaceae bacterium]